MTTVPDMYEVYSIGLVTKWKEGCCLGRSVLDQMIRKNSFDGYLRTGESLTIINRSTLHTKMRLREKSLNFKGENVRSKRIRKRRNSKRKSKN